MSILRSPLIPIGAIVVAALIATNSFSSAQNSLFQPPTNLDDENTGFKQGDLWQTADSRMFYATETKSGKARWSELTNKQRPLDVVTGSAAAFGISRLSARYRERSAFEVTRKSDGAIKAVGFSGDTVDFENADQFCAGTTCVVTKWYDQSGNGNDVAQSHFDNAPSWLSPDARGHRRGISFNSIVMNGLSLQRGPRNLTSEKGPIWSPTASTWFIVGQHVLSKETRTIVSDATGGFAVFSAFVSLIPGIRLTGQGINTTTPAEIDPSVLTVSFQNGVIEVTSNNVTSSEKQTAEVANKTGLTLGSNNPQAPSNFDALAVVLFDRNLSPSEIVSERAALHTIFAVVPQSRDILVADGDSTTVALASTRNNTFTRITLSDLDRPIRSYNIAVTGMTMKELAQTGIWNLKSLYSPSAVHFIVHVLCGANDLRLGADAASVFGALRKYVADAKSLGPNVQVIVSTEMVQADVLRNSRALRALQEYNDAIRANWNRPQSEGGLNADALADYWADASIGPGNYDHSAFADPECAPDGQHPTDACMQRLSRVQVSAILNVLHDR